MFTRTLNAEMVEAAYREGVFPMAEPDFGVISWHRPDPRTILPLDSFHCSHSLKKTLRRGIFEVTFDQDFKAVMEGCRAGRPVWISDDFLKVYGQLHKAGKAHSVEVWHEGKLAGGLYGVHLGGAFMAESKFHRVTDASKVALFSLVQRMNERGFKLLDVQFLTEHLRTLGAVEITDAQYMRKLRAALKRDCQLL